MSVRIDRVVTRGGDGGETSLGDGTRVGKGSAIIEAIGSVDELNAVIGVVRACLEAGDGQQAVLSWLQSSLFDLGADLCMPEDGKRPVRLGAGAVQRLEREIEALRAAQPALTSFVLPGGTMAAAQAHLMRTVARRAERRVIACGRWAGPSVAVRFLNRLSDYGFVLARHLNEDGARDVLWVPAGA